MYAFVRTDLSGPQIAVQTAHACIETARSGLIPTDSEHPHLILFGAKNESELLKIESRLKDTGFDFKSFREPDKNNELTAICTAPIYGQDRQHFRRYQLLRPKYAQIGEINV